MEFHRQSADILQVLHDNLQQRITEAAARPKREVIPKRATSSCFDKSPSGYDQNNFDGLDSKSYSLSPAPAYNNTGSANGTPCAKALYDFEPENEGELEFSEGDIITLTNQIDENWFEGSVNGKSGFFPVNYVDVMVPL